MPETTCEKELLKLINAGPAGVCSDFLSVATVVLIISFRSGVEVVRTSYRSIQRHYCGDDAQLWSSACRAVFTMLPIRTAVLLEKKGWDLSGLHAEQLYE